ncbi:MAG: hypothetical protein KDD62_02230, partial [Bdellovibrionales bacterium]|nr:hypothetical protein [Bdellovibrionales bacterium]
MKKRFNYLICLCLFAPTLVSAQADSMYSDTEELVTPGSEIIQSYDDTVVGDTATDYSAIPAALLALDLKKKEYCVTLELDACNADGDYRCKRPTAGRNHERPWNSEMTECMKDRIQDDVAGDAVEECKEGQVPEFRFFEDFKESKYTLKCYGEGANDKISEFETTL